MTTVPSVPLNDGTAIPQVGYGVLMIPDDETEAVVTTAIEAGYRSIDTATIYGNEAGVGAAIAASNVPRDELYVTTKLWNTDQDRPRAALESSLERLGLSSVDLYLIHWPMPAQDRYVDAWRALRELRDEGLARTIGVSNFEVHHLERLERETDVVPAVNQIELHPRLVQPELRAFHAAHGIVTEAWSPLARGALLDDPTLVSIARAHDRAPAQVVLRWHVQLGNVAIPKSATPERIAANLAVFDFALTDDEMASISALNAPDGRTGPHPDTYDGS
ncbi:MAG: aldo/keto reductase [Patulibacter sp.]|nr:aldo/keto reductase [Patulibacter sp.]